MKNQFDRLLCTLPVLCCLTACSTVTGAKHKDEQLLPDSGETTVEIIAGNRPTHSYYGNGVQAAYTGQSLSPGYRPNSSYSNTHISELQRDFKRIPNPEIVGYVYPHINNNEMPIPGYYTTFLLYERSHFALSSEGYNE